MQDTIKSLNGHQLQDSVARATADANAAAIVYLEEQIAEIKANGGGGSSNNAVLTLTNTTGWLTKTVSSGASVTAAASWSSLEDGIETGPGTMKLTVNGSLKQTKNVQQGDVSVELKDVLVPGSNNVRLTISDVYGNSRNLSFTLNVISLVLTSPFDASGQFSGAVQFPYVPIGAVEKTVHIILDGTEIGTQTVTASGRQQTYIIPAQSHGAHNLRVFFDAMIDGEKVESNDLYYDLICIEPGNMTPVIASNFRKTKADQYDLLQIEHRVYDPANLTATVTYWAEGEQFTEGTVDRTSQILEFRPDVAGEITLEIRCGDTVKPFTLTVDESGIQIEAETQNLALHLTSYGRSNNETNPGTWTSGDVAATFTDFNFVSDGWQRDNEGNTVLRVGGDARLTIPYNIFGSDFRTTGKTIELEFASRDVLNYDAVILSCMSGGRGIEVTAQQANLISEQSKIGTQYKEERHVRLSFVVEKRSGRRLLLIYLNGILSGIRQYANDDDFAQTAPVGITIGSSECTIDLYNIRVYDNDLTRHQIVDNWVADTQDLNSRVDRYQFNNVYDAYGAVVADKLPKTLPYLVFTCVKWPQYKGDKVTASGYYVDPLHPEKCFTFEGAEIDVQGTSSQYYYIKNIKAKYKNGMIVNGVSMTVYAMTDDSIPVSVFTYKTDVASDGATNVVLTQLFEETSPYVSPAKEADPRVRQTIAGMPITLFWDSGDGPKFYARANFNNDKATHEIFGYGEGDERWETSNNVSAYAMWQTALLFESKYTEAFEPTYPEDNTDVSNLAVVARWIASTNRAKATNAAISPVTYDGVTYATDSAEYRLAKFKAELTSYFNFKSCIHYFTFTEFFLMVDSRTKNSFPTRFSAERKWSWPMYDADTGNGINNEGVAVFDYAYESGDKLPSGADVFNAAGNVFWLNIKDCFPAEIAAEYKRLRLLPQFSYESVIQRFANHLAAWPEAIVNEDAWRKRIEPYEQLGETMYFDMERGKDELRREWWLYNRFRYMDAKYDTGDVASDFALMRIYAPGEIEAVVYADTYMRIKMGNFEDSFRVKRGVRTKLPCRVDAANDLETTLYPASLYTELYGLPALMIGQFNAAPLVKLVRLELGSAEEGYTNANLTNLSFGDNKVLRYARITGCVNLAMAIDMSGCTNLEEAYYDGTSITGLSLPNGGQVRIVRYPATIKNLTVLNQRKIAEFDLPEEAYAKIETLRIEHSSDLIPTREILFVMPVNSRVRLIGIDWTMDDADAVLALYDRLDQMRGLDENGNNVDKAQVSGTLHIDSLTGAELAEMQSRYPYIKIEYQHIASYCYFWNRDGSRLLYTAECLDGADAVYAGSTPSETATPQYTYTWQGGWSTAPNADTVDDNALKHVTADRNVYAVFTATLRYYSVYFYIGNKLDHTVNNVPYGGSANYPKDDPVHATDPDNYVFSGWNPGPSNIQGNTSCYAQFRYTGYLYTQLIDGSITGEFVDEELTTVGERAFYGCNNLTKVNLPAVTSVGASGLGSCTSLAWVELASCTSLGDYALSSNRALETLILHAEDEMCIVGTGALNMTAISNGNGYVYVPTALTSVYSANSKWNATIFSTSQFRAIEDYPEVWPKYAWETVAYHIEQGDYASYYAIGDLIPLDMGTEGQINMQIAGFDVDDLADGTGKAHISFISKELLKTSKRWNPALVTNDDGTYQEGTGTIGGWEKSELRAYYNDTLLPLIPSEVAALIKPVTKTQTAYDTAGASFTQTTTETIWPPSRPEVYGSNSLYYSLFKNTNANRIKYKVSTTNAAAWWNRSAHSTNNPHDIYIYGGEGYDSVNNTMSCPLCFCV